MIQFFLAVRSFSTLTTPPPSPFPLPPPSSQSHNITYVTQLINYVASKSIQCDVLLLLSYLGVSCSFCFATPINDIIVIVAAFNPIRSGLFQTVNDPWGGGGFKSPPPPLRSRKLLCQSSPYHTCEFYQVFLA